MQVGADVVRGCHVKSSTQASHACKTLIYTKTTICTLSARVAQLVERLTSMPAENKRVSRLQCMDIRRSSVQVWPRATSTPLFFSCREGCFLTHQSVAVCEIFETPVWFSYLVLRRGHVFFFLQIFPRLPAFPFFVVAFLTFIPLLTPNHLHVA